MSETCAICQNSAKKLKNIHKSKIGKPSILIKDLLKLCFDDRAELPNGIGRKADTSSSICANCENKLLEFYDARLKLALKRKEFHRLLKTRTCTDQADIIKSRASSDESSNGLCEIEKVEWDEEYKPDIENVSWNNIEDKDESEEEQESLALIQTRLQSEKANRFCRECNVKCSNDQVFQLHLKVHGKCDTKESLAFSTHCCPKCDKELPTEPAYKEHLRSCHKSMGRLKCSQCEKTFNRKHQLNAHQEMHFTLLCSYCGNNFENKRAYKQHMETQHIDIKRFQCDECGNLYSSSKSLKKHKMVHSDTRNYNCDECPRRFRNSSHLKRHKLTHSGLKPHVCPVCYRSFALKYNMVSHMREHSKPGNLTRRLECRNCRKFFTAQQLLKQHLAAGGCQIAKEDIRNQSSEIDELADREDEMLDDKTEIEFINDQYSSYGGDLT